MIKSIFIVIVAVIFLTVTTILILAAAKPDTFRVMRSVAIKAPAARIYDHVEDFRKWVDWSPWEKMGPMERTYGPHTRGKGATYAWAGDQNVGAGRMEIVEAESPARIVIKLDFVKPFEAHNMVEFKIEPHGETTTVTWDMQGPLPYFFKIFHVIFNMDAMVGTDFETGLANIKLIT